MRDNSVMAGCGAFGVCLALAGACSAQTAPSLQCQLSYAGAVHRLQVHPVSEPYAVPSIDIGGRFRFKAVMVGSGALVERIALYAYRIDDASQPRLIHQAKYLPPYPHTPLPWPLTGEQRLYAGRLERELIYSCMLEGVTP